jgi:hypothetical protein
MFLKNYGFQSEAAVDLSDVIRRFEVKRAYEGPQVLLEWEFYDEGRIAGFKIMKKEGAYPLSINDGVLVALGSSSGAYGDLEVDEGTIYYYTLFVRSVGENDFVFDTISMGKALAIATGYYQDLLWKSLPQIYRIRDEMSRALQTTQVN